MVKFPKTLFYKIIYLHILDYVLNQFSICYDKKIDINNKKKLTRVSRFKNVKLKKKRKEKTWF